MSNYVRAWSYEWHLESAHLKGRPTRLCQRSRQILRHWDVSFFGIAIGACIAAGLVAGYMSVMFTAGKEVDQKWGAPDPSFETGLAALQSSAGPVVVSLRRACAPDDSIKPAQGLRRGVRDPYMEQQLRRDFIYLRELAGYLVCIMGRDIDRLCQADQRRRLVEDYNTYLGRRRFFMTFVEMFEAENNSQYVQIERQLKSRNGRMPVEQSPRAVFEELDDDVGQALRKLAMAGFISEGDFGFFAPGEVRKHFAALGKIDQPCR